MSTRLYYHKTDGGAEYLCTSAIEGTDEGDLSTAVIRLDGEPELVGEFENLHISQPEDKKYNGWNNYETWCVNLWLTNSEGEDAMIREWTQECYDDAQSDQYFTRLERATLDLSDRIKDYIEEAQDEFMNNQQTGLFTDLLNSAISQVDYQEIAESFMEDVEQEIEEA